MALLMSRVNTPDANPYSVSLALCSTPSTSLRLRAGEGQGIEVGGSRLGLHNSGHEGSMIHFFVDLPICEFGHHHDRTEGLLFGNEHVILHISEHSGLHEKT